MSDVDNMRMTFIHTYLYTIKSYSLGILTLKVTKKKSTSFVGFLSAQNKTQRENMNDVNYMRMTYTHIAFCNYL